MTPSSNLPPRRSYARAPIVERIATFHAQIEEERFLLGFEEWQWAVREDYPHHEPHKEWLIAVKEKNGVPLFDTLQPELRLTHLFSRKSADGRREFGMRCPMDAIAFHLFTSPGVSKGYGDLHSEVVKWLPRWMDHFQVEKLTNLELHYSNRITPETVGPFIRDGRIELASILTAFLALPGTHECLIPPYDCTATVLLREEPQMVLTLRIHGDTEVRPQPAVLVDFTVAFPETKGGLDTGNALLLLSNAHDAIQDRFELVFTDQVKNFFSKP